MSMETAAAEGAGPGPEQAGEADRADEIRQRTGATKLVFEVRMDDGKVRLVGRPAPAKG